jgi:hypothetical protein
LKDTKLSKGVAVIEDIQLRLSEIRITQNRELQYSPVLSSDNPIAANAITPIAVAPTHGGLLRLAGFPVAIQGGWYG